MGLTLLFGIVASATVWVVLSYRRFRACFVPVLLYHFFTDQAPRNSLEITLEAFSRQLRMLRRLGFSVIPLRALLNGAALPSRAVVITSDDGDISVFEKALPLLEQFGFPLTAFVVVDSLSRGSFESDSQVRTAATWEQLRGWLARYPKLEIGCHSWGHRSLPGCGGAELTRELGDAAKVLEARLGRRADILAYPYGRWNSEVVERARAAGYRAACTTTWGDALRRDAFQIEREPIYADTTTWKFVFKILGVYSFVRNMLRERHWRNVGAG